MSKAYGYIFCHHADADEMTASIALQTEAIVRASAVTGHGLKRVFVDIGSHQSARAQRNKMLTIARLKEVEAIVATSSSRFASEPLELAIFIDELKLRGFALVTADNEDISDENYAFAWTR